MQREPYVPIWVRGTKMTAQPSKTVASAMDTCQKNGFLLTSLLLTTPQRPNPQHSYRYFLLGKDMLFSITALFRGKIPLITGIMV